MFQLIKRKSSALFSMSLIRNENKLFVILFFVKARFQSMNCHQFQARRNESSQVYFESTYPILYMHLISYI